MTKLILASASLGRKYLLDKLKLDYETIHTNLDEEKIISDNPINTIKLRAKLKGEEALKQITKNKQQITNNKEQITNNKEQITLNIKPVTYNQPPKTYNLKPITYLILSADTEVILDGKLFGKPSSEKEAVKMLKTLSGKTHEVVTGIYIIISNIPASPAGRQYPISNIETWSDYDISRVTFRKLTDSDIKRYLKYTDYTRYTGGYALVASPQDFVTKVEGSISNVIGLPMEKVIRILDKYFNL